MKHYYVKKANNNKMGCEYNARKRPQRLWNVNGAASYTNNASEYGLDWND
jgi:hypothetical protein